MKCIVIVSAATMLAASPAVAQGVEEIVVTGARLSEYDASSTPQVTLRKRADNLITIATVVCDTRDESPRKAELKATLRNLVRAAGQDQRIDLAVGDEVLGAFDESMLDAVIQKGSKVDTSTATLIIKTSVSAEDTFDSATGRIESFVGRAPKVGRTEVLLDDDWQLTLVNPGQYRPQVAKLIAEDARRMAALYGDGYGVEVQGLQLPVSWYQAGPLDLAIYIPYRLNVRPNR